MRASRPMKTSVSYLALLPILLTIVFTVIGQVLVKQGALEVGDGPERLKQVPGFIWRAFMNWRVLLGLASAVLAAAAWVMALSRSDLSFAYPFMGLAIVSVLVVSGLFLGEHVPPIRWLGVAIVCIGIVIASR